MKCIMYKNVIVNLKSFCQTLHSDRSFGLRYVRAFIYLVPAARSAIKNPEQTLLPTV